MQYMCGILRCITDVTHTQLLYLSMTLGIHMFHTCNTRVHPTHALLVKKYMCNTCVGYTPVLHMSKHILYI